MLFQREKELWRYASKNLSTAFDGMSNLEPLQLLPHQLQRPPQARYQYQNEYQHQPHSLCNTKTIWSTLPPPYDAEYSAASTETSYERKGNASESGCSYESSCDAMSAVAYVQVQTANSRIPNRCWDYTASCPERSLQVSAKHHSTRMGTELSTTTVTTTIGTFAATVNMLRNCCGGGTIPTDSRTSCTTISTDFELDGKNFDDGHQATDLKAAKQLQIAQQYFRKLMKILKWQQQAALLEAVKSRIDSSAVQHSRCIVLPRSLIFTEEPYVIACRLFFWPNLRDATELKCLPICPIGRDPVYLCCNPLHWCRVLETETAPPPYQRLGMERLQSKGESLDYLANSSNSSVGNNNNTSTRKGRMSTDGEDRHTWCQVAYWELNERVGNRFCVRKPSVNIYADGPSEPREYSDDMCLKELGAKKKTPSRESVEYTRQKIGLGLILSQEADGVWVYNRSKTPVFILSPTLNESLSCVYKVNPGDCLKAFDCNRAQSLIYCSQFPGAEVGPINTHSMCISFAKGWGERYKRQDIMRCPCWLEILFTQR